MLSKLFLFLVVLLGGFVRFYKLDWGEGYFFHPDEYHIANAVSRLSFPSQMNPQFFAYGSFVTYLIYFTRIILAFFDSRFSNFSPILIGRFWSAFFSTLTIIVVYFISRQNLSSFISLLVGFLCAFLPGLIQQAHFATPESILTFWLFLTLYFWLLHLKLRKQKFLFFSAISLGLALSTKITAAVFLPVLLLVILINWRFDYSKKIVRIFKQTILSFLIVFLIFFLVFPYSLLDWHDFYHSMKYETGVGRGKPIVFYTRQFINTKPILFQLEKILPYVLGPGVLLLGLMGLFLMIKEGHKKRQLIIVLLAFLSYFLANAFLFAKWTRFIAPTFPFFVLSTGYFFEKVKKRIFLIFSSFLLVINCLYSFAFFSLYLRPDVRIKATSWLKERLTPGSFILTESGNMLEVPLNGDFQKISFDFYHLDEQQELQHRLADFLVKSDFFIIQSRRIFINHQRLANQFPKTNKFYELLFSGRLGFKKIKEFNSYPQLSIFGFRFFVPDERAEETWSVFDHPVIRIYQKTKRLSQKDYESLLQI